MSEFKLIKEILSASLSKNWEIAKFEWALKDVFFAEEYDTCLCGHYPIVELCVLQNQKNNKKVIVGNCCVKKFMGLPSDNIFQAIKRVKKDKSRSLNSQAIDHAFNKNWINKWEYDFYNDTFRKRKLSEKQEQKRIQINEKVFKSMSSQKTSEVML